jgi:hypothetical protein
MVVRALVLEEVVVLLGLSEVAVATWMLWVLESTVEAYDELLRGVYLERNPH